MLIAPPEWGRFVAKYPSAQLEERSDGTAVVHMPSIPLPDGWSSPTTSVWFLVPMGYPAAQPDCFWAGEELRLANGGMPSNSGLQPVAGQGQARLWFSWHLASWRPSLDNVSTYARFIEKRF